MKDLALVIIILTMLTCLSLNVEIRSSMDAKPEIRDKTKLVTLDDASPVALDNTTLSTGTECTKAQDTESVNCLNTAANP
tara:strand:+ start:367 stop:606 length:240 start_codon:yes stop_codon:yes gene_type:complete